MSGFTHKVRLHFRSLSLTDIPFATILRTTKRIYAPYGIKIEMASAQSLLLTAAQRAIFDRALSNAFRFDNKFVKEDRQQIVENQLANLKKAIFAHPGHSGPAHAAGAGAFEQAKHQLEQLLVEGQFPAFDKNHWAASLSTYRTAGESSAVINAVNRRAGASDRDSCDSR